MPSIYLTPGEVDSLTRAIDVATAELEIALKPFRRVATRDLLTEEEEEEKQRLTSIAQSKAVLTKLQTIVKESE